MSNGEHPLGSPGSKRVRCTFGPVRDVDLVWPPPAEELDACSVIQLDDSDARPPVKPVPPIQSAVPPPVTPALQTAVPPRVQPVPPLQAAVPSSAPALVAPAVTSTVHNDGKLAVEQTPADAHPPAPSTRAHEARLPVRPAFGNDGRTPVKLALGNDVRPALKPTFGDCRAPGVAPRIQVKVAPLIPVEPPPLPQPPPLPAATFFALPEPPPLMMRPSDIHALHAHIDLSRVDELVPFPLAGRPPVTDAASDGAVRSAWLALFVAASCALVTYSEFRAVPAPTARTVAALKSAPVVASPVAAQPAPEPPAPEPLAPEPLAPVPMPEPIAIADAGTARPVPEAIAAVAAKRPVRAPVVDRAPARRADVAKTATPLRAAAAVRPTPTPVTPTVRDCGSVAGPAQPRISTPVRQDAPVAAAMTPPAATVAPVAASAPAPALALAPTPTPAPLANPAPAKLVAAVVTDPVGDDEAHIRTTLTRFRTAYSQLNASAAREVWPSVDARALERAFQGLKSQDLRFDSCSLTVNGARAQAACKGRAVYVPRVGDQSPRRTSREWTFELKKADEGWTIASARSL